MSAHNFEPSQQVKGRQCSAILNALCKGPVSTIYAHEELGICHPAARIRDLRLAGFDISTNKGTVLDQGGRKHTCAVYQLREEEHHG